MARTQEPLAAHIKRAVRDWNATAKKNDSATYSEEFVTVLQDIANGEKPTSDALAAAVADGVEVSEAVGASKQARQIASLERKLAKLRGDAGESEEADEGE